MKKLLLTLCAVTSLLKADLAQDLKIHCEDRIIQHAFLLEDLWDFIDMNAYAYIMGKQAAYLEIMEIISDSHCKCQKP